MGLRWRFWCVVVAVLLGPGGGRAITQADGRGSAVDWSRRESPRWESAGVQWNRAPAWGAPKGERVVQQPPQDAGVSAGASALEGVLGQPMMRWPVVVLVDTDPESLANTRRLWDEVRLLPSDNQFEIISFNDTNTGPVRRSRGAAGVRRELEAVRDASVGGGGSGGGAAFLALLTAAQRARRPQPGDPQRCAALLFTSRPAADDQYAGLAARELTARRCQVYVWWSGGSTKYYGAERLLRELSLYTGGQFYEVDVAESSQPEPNSNVSPFTTGSSPQFSPTQASNVDHPKQPNGDVPNNSEWSDNSPDTKHNQVILAARQGLSGLTTTSVLVDSSVEDITVYILGYVSKAFIRNPTGSTVYLLGRAGAPNGEGVGDADDGLLELRLNTRGVPPGLWQLTADDGRGSTSAGPAESAERDPAAGYDVVVKGTSGLTVNVLRANVSDAGTWVDQHGDLIVTVHGEPHTTINNITDVVLLDENGNELRKASYKQRVRRDPQNREVYELVVPSTSLQQQQQQQQYPHYVQVKGYGGAQSGYKTFERITPQIPTTGNLIVMLNALSNLTIQPGTQSQIYLDVINNGSRPSRMYVYGSSSRNILYKITPNSLQLNPNQRRTVSLLLYAQPSLNGFGDTIKIQVHGELTITELFLEINIADSIYERRDTRKPSFQHKIISNCKEIESCYSKQWNMEATVEDTDSGIREVTSQPQGILWAPMIIGTKLPITLRYRASCCDENVIITVRDLQNNVAQHTINVNEESSGLSAGAIAGIVVGCVVLLIIIIVIISVIVCKKKKTHTFQTQQVPR